MVIRIEVRGERRVLRQLAEIERGLQDRRDPHRKVGEFLIERTKQRVQSGRGPTGRLRPLSIPTLIRRGGFGKPLVDTGAMIRSLKFEVRGARGDSRTIIQPRSRRELMKGKVHQFGRGVPVREWLGFAPEDERPIRNEFESHAQKQIRLGGGTP